MVELVDQIIQKVTSLATVLAGLFILATAVIVCYEVIARGLFDAPTEWSLELSVYLVLASGFLGLAATYADDKHIRVDILTARLSERSNACLTIFVGIVVTGMCFVFLVESWDMVLTSYQMNNTSPSTLRVPLFIPQLSLPVGFLLLLLQLARKIILDILDLSTKRRLTPEKASKRRDG
ncbi:TRAP transporter small permease [Sporomusa ovata]|uniref:TRAP transporter small permease n=1 Tax=Sporomusa ovata TaxID=2378 RepID=UPI001F464B55|nr:TRAP transporter small permease [Sporomusa ovata]